MRTENTGEKEDKSARVVDEICLEAQIAQGQSRIA